MEIYDFEIRRWTKEFSNIRKVLQTSANFVRWYTPTKRICCQREDDEDDEDVEKIFLQLAKSTKEAHYIKASRKLAKVFIDNVYSTEAKRLITLPLPK